MVRGIRYVCMLQSGWLNLEYVLKAMLDILGHGDTQRRAENFP